MAEGGETTMRTEPAVKNVFPTEEMLMSENDVTECVRLITAIQSSLADNLTHVLRQQNIRLRNEMEKQWHCFAGEMQNIIDNVAHSNSEVEQPENPLMKMLDLTENFTECFEMLKRRLEAIQKHWFDREKWHENVRLPDHDIIELGVSHRFFVELKNLLLLLRSHAGDVGANYNKIAHSAGSLIRRLAIDLQRDGIIRIFKAGISNIIYWPSTPAHYRRPVHCVVMMKDLLRIQGVPLLEEPQGAIESECSLAKTKNEFLWNEISVAFFDTERFKVFVNSDEGLRQSRLGILPNTKALNLARNDSTEHLRQLLEAWTSNMPINTHTLCGVIEAFVQRENNKAERQKIADIFWDELCQICFDQDKLIKFAQSRNGLCLWASEVKKAVKEHSQSVKAQSLSMFWCWEKRLFEPATKADINECIRIYQRGVEEERKIHSAEAAELGRHGCERKSSSDLHTGNRQDITEIKKIDMSNSCFNEPAIKSLANIINSCKKLSRLKIQNSNLSKTLLDSLYNGLAGTETEIFEIDLSRTTQLCAGAFFVAKIAWCAHVQLLDFSYCQLDEKNLEDLHRGLGGYILETLVLNEKKQSVTEAELHGITALITDVNSCLKLLEWQFSKDQIDRLQSASNDKASQLVIQISEMKLSRLAIQRKIGPSGGKLEIDGCSVIFPNGAVEKSTLIEIAVDIQCGVADDDWVDVTPTLSCRSHGSKTFLKAVQIELSTWLTSTKDLPIFISHNVGGKKLEVTEARLVDGKIVFETHGFCTFTGIIKRFLFGQYSFSIVPIVFHRDNCHFATVLCRENETLIQRVKNDFLGYERTFPLLNSIISKPDDEITHQIECLKPDSFKFREGYVTISMCNILEQGKFVCFFSPESYDSKTLRALFAYSIKLRDGKYQPPVYHIDWPITKDLTRIMVEELPDGVSEKDGGMNQHVIRNIVAENVNIHGRGNLHDHRKTEA